MYKRQGESLDNLITCDDVLRVVLCMVWVIKLLPTHAILEHFTMLETELPCQLSQHLMSPKMTGRSSSEATMHCKKMNLTHLWLP